MERFTSAGLRAVLEKVAPAIAAGCVTIISVEAIRERSAERDRARAIQAKAGISRSVTELWRRHDGRADAMLQYSLEWAFFGRAQWGEFDTAVWELEKAWSEGTPAAPSPIGPDAARPVPARTIRSVADVHEAMDAYVRALKRGDDPLDAFRDLVGQPLAEFEKVAARYPIFRIVAK